mmetsp:Transcript_88214/g.152490  ORF Transcript_88214/g.152490 Transcript_88214/m.152490 type:complete len:80 (+) Transcript_88214:1066-1305(+)
MSVMLKIAPECGCTSPLGEQTASAFYERRWVGVYSWVCDSWFAGSLSNPRSCGDAIVLIVCFMRWSAYRSDSVSLCFTC